LAAFSPRRAKATSGCGAGVAVSGAAGLCNGSRAICEDDEPDKMRRLGTDSIVPHRLNHKTFTR
jgi:hypothetical protein